MGTNLYTKYNPRYDFGGKKVLNVGCGFAQFSAKNVTNLDASATCHPNVTWNLEKTPLPFKDETFDLIIANHVLEHINKWWDCFNDLARICKTGGIIEAWVPGGDSDSAMGYRDHVHTINHCSFYGTLGTYREGSNAWAVDNMICHANRMKMMRPQIRMENMKWCNHLPVFMKQWCLDHLRNVSCEVGYIFQKVTKADVEKAMEWYTKGRKELEAYANAK